MSETCPLPTRGQFISVRKQAMIDFGQRQCIFPLGNIANQYNLAIQFKIGRYQILHPQLIYPPHSPNK